MYTTIHIYFLFTEKIPPPLDVSLTLLQQYTLSLELSVSIDHFGV